MTSRRPAADGERQDAPLPAAGVALAEPSPVARRTFLHLSLGVYLRIRTFAGALVALVAIVVYLSFTQPFFLTRANILNVLDTNATLFIVAIGMTFVVLSAGYDLSVGAVLAGSGVLFPHLIQAGVPQIAAMVLVLACGAAFGAIVNGTLIGRFKLNFFVVTLGTMGALYGFVDVATTGQTITLPGSGPLFELGNASVSGVSVPTISVVVVMVIAAVVLRFTTYGRAVYSVGGNREAARLAGINVTVVLVSVYALASLCAAFAGLVQAGQLGAAAPTAGSNLDLTAGAAVLLGGTSFFGGVGGVTGTMIGVLLIATVQNGLGIVGVSDFWQGVVTGVVLVAAVSLDRVQSRLLLHA